MTLPVVDKLAAHGAVDLLLCVSEIAQLHGRPILTKAVGKDTIRRGVASEMQDLRPGRLEEPESFDMLHDTCRIASRELNLAERLRVVRSNFEHQVWCAGKP